MSSQSMSSPILVTGSSGLIGSQAVRHFAALGRRVATIKTDDPDADTLPHGTSRDRIAARLLEIAAALDDALAVAHQPTPGGEAASGALARLREEIGFARKALPDANR